MSDSKNLKNDMENAFREATSISSHKDKNYADYIQKKYDLILGFFEKIDKNKDANIDFNELIKFLDSNLEPGKEFDRDTANKLMKLLDTDSNGLISLNEFARVFIQLEEELKLHLTQIKTRYADEKANYNKFLGFSQQYKNEKLTNEGLSENSVIKFEIEELRLHGLNFDSGEISIQLKQNTRPVCNSKRLEVFKVLIFSELFEIKVKSISEIIDVEILYHENSEKQECLGIISLPIENIDNDDENDIEMEIPNSSFEMSIKMKVQFIRSFYKYYYDNALKAEEQYKFLENSMQDSQKLLENLNEPFGFFNQLNDKKEFNGFNTKNYLNTNSQTNFFKGETSKSDEIQAQYADRIENLLKNVLKKPKLPWAGVLKIILPLVLVLSFISLLNRPDFLGIILVSYILIVFYTTFNADIFENLKTFFNISALLVVIEVFWFLFVHNSSSDLNFDGNAERGLRELTNFVNFLGFICKFLMMFIFWTHKLKMQKGESENLNPFS